MSYYILKSYKLNFPALALFEILNKEKNCFFLDSSLNHNSLGRYSFLGIEPFLILQAKGEDPFKALRAHLQAWEMPVSRDEIPFFGGAVGYLAYDFGFILEGKVKKKYKLDLGIPDLFFGFYNTVIILDHYKELFHILSLGYPEKKYFLARKLAERNFKKILGLISKINVNQRKIKSEKDIFSEDLHSNFTRAGYINAVQRALQYIRSGDIYQVNLTQQFTARSKAPSYQIYNRLRNVSPSCFSGYLDTGDFQIISSSPERFLKLAGNTVITRPMKGTRPRSRNRLKDNQLRQELLHSPKDKAELMMIVDLERNDLGKACSYHSIKVAALRELEEYQTVFQATATIEGKLHKDKDRIDLLRVCFPGGSIIGCPKIRAMEIIEELEPDRRSIYTGCLGYLSFSGGMDFNILIRSILKKGNNLYFGVGGGIVADSKPEEEYQETLVKAKGILKAINAR